MAANTNSFIRVRLFFDYPPPAVADCRMCWLLVDLKTCRVVADVESVIRDKFHFSSRSLLSLFIDDCYLPHTEHVLVLRDNDSVRVKVDSGSLVNGHSSSSDKSSKSCKKRKKPADDDDDDGTAGTAQTVDQEEKRIKTKNTEILEDVQEVKEKKKKKKKKKEKSIKEKTPQVVPKQSPAPRESPPSVQKLQVKRANKPLTKPQGRKPSASSSSSSSSVEDEAPKRLPAPKPAAKTPAGSKTKQQTPKPKAAPRPATPSSSSSDDDDVRPPKHPASNKPLSSSPPKTKVHKPPPSELQPKNRADPDPNPNPNPDPNPPGEALVPSDSGSEDEIKLVIKKPTQLQGFAMGGPRAGWRGGERGGGRGRYGQGNRGGRGGEGQGSFGGRAGHLESSSDGNTRPSYHTDVLSNNSRIVQNGATVPPKQDYSSMPLLAAPPQVGQKIAFKLLELAENYTPEVSDYKEGRIVTFDPTSRQIELELLHTAHAPVEPGKFDLVYQNADGSERVEYAVSRDNWVTERWDSLLEPRLII